MKAGDFDRLVTISHIETPDRNDWGEEEGTPTTVQAWAAKKPAPGTERYANSENAATAPTRFFFRWRPDLIKPTFTITDELGLDYDVKSVNEIGRRQLLEVLAVARTDQ